MKERLAKKNKGKRVVGWPHFDHKKG